MPEHSALEADLDAAHSRAKARYRAKDLGGFMEGFAPGLKYKQPDGRTIGWDQLAQDVASQFVDLEEADTTYVRESLQVDGERATEIIAQTAVLTFRHWFFFKRSLRLARRGRYTWVRLADGWKIEGVDVLSESVTRGAA